MADTDLNIVLKLIDEASAGIKKAMGEMASETKKAEDASKKYGKESKKTTDSIQQGFKEANKGVRAFHQVLGTLTFAMAGLAITTKVWAEQNSQTRKALDTIALTMKNITGLIGSLFAPLIIALGSIMGNVFSFMKDLVFGLQQEFLWLFSTISFGIQRLVAFTAAMKSGVGVVEAWAIAGKVARQAVNEMTGEIKKGFESNIPSMDAAKLKLKEINDLIETQKTRYISGEISAKEFYESVNTEASKALMVNQALAQSIEQMAVLKTVGMNPEVVESQMIIETMQQRVQLERDLMYARDVSQQDLRNKMSEQTALLNFKVQEHRIATQGMAAFTVALGQTIQTNLSQSLTGIITGAKTAKEAFKELGMAMIETIVQFMVQKLVAFALEKTILAGTVAMATSAAATLTAVWATPAFLATVATLGAAAAQAPASLAAAGAASIGVVGALGAASKAMVSVSSQMVGGGKVLAESGGGGFAEGTPQVPYDMITRVHKGEMIVPSNFAEGIRQGDVSLGSRGGGGDINIVINYPKLTNKEEISDLVNTLGMEIEKQMRYARGI